MAKSKKESKVFDVAKPGNAKPDIGSKPMIIGHKSVAADPMIKEDEKSTNTDKEKSEDKAEPAEIKDKVKIEPVSEDMKPKDEKPDKTPEKPSEPEDSAQVVKENKQPSEKPDETQPDNTNTKEEDNKDSDTDTNNDSKKDEKKDPKLDPVAIAMEQEDKLNKLVESKKYNVEIKEKKSGALKTFLFVFIGLVVSGLLAIFVLIDTNTIESDIKLPFRIFGSEKVATVPAEVSEQQQPETEKQAEESMEVLSIKDSTNSYSFSYPQSWNITDYVWVDCCEGEPKEEPDWNETPQPVNIKPDMQIDNSIEILGFLDGSITIDDIRADQTEDQFNTHQELTINGNEVYYNKLDFVDPSASEKYIDHTYYVYNDKVTIKITFREKYSNTTLDGENDFDSSSYISDFESLISSVEFL